MDIKLAEQKISDLFWCCLVGNDAKDTKKCNFKAYYISQPCRGRHFKM